MDPSIPTDALGRGKAIKKIIDQAMALDKPKDNYPDHPKSRPKELTMSSQTTDV
jgi:hypothetical protein